MRNTNRQTRAAMIFVAVMCVGVVTIALIKGGSSAVTTDAPGYVEVVKSAAPVDSVDGTAKKSKSSKSTKAKKAEAAVKTDNTPERPRPIDDVSPTL